MIVSVVVYTSGHDASTFGTLVGGCAYSGFGCMNTSPLLVLRYMAKMNESDSSMQSLLLPCRIVGGGGGDGDGDGGGDGGGGMGGGDGGGAGGGDGGGGMGGGDGGGGDGGGLGSLIALHLTATKFAKC
jgi:hypothetical protein